MFLVNRKIQFCLSNWISNDISYLSDIWMCLFLCWLWVFYMNLDILVPQAVEPSLFHICPFFFIFRWETTHYFHYLSRGKEDKFCFTLFPQEILLNPFLIVSNYPEVALNFTVLPGFYSCSVMISCFGLQIPEVLVKDLTKKFVPFCL